VTRFPTKAHFASWDGTAPIDASSGDQVRHRLSRAGNRQVNRVLHIMAVVQLRNPTEGRAYYDRKVAAGKTPREVMRALKRRLSDIVYHQMIIDARARATGPGGHVGAATGSSAAGLHPSAGAASTSRPPGPGPLTLSPPGTASAPYRTPPDQQSTIPAIQEGAPGARGTPGHPARQPGHRHTPTQNQDPLPGAAAIPGQRPVIVNHQG
jgi:transposase